MLEVENERGEVRRLSQIVKAIRYVTEPCNSTIASDIARTDNFISQATSAQLVFLRPYLVNDIKGARKFWGIQADEEVLVRLAQGIEATPAQRLVLLPMYFVRGLFRDPDKIFPPKQHVANHAVVLIDPRGTFYDANPGKGFALRLLEQSLYEDMCVLFNSAKAQSVQPDAGLKITMEVAFCRSAMSAAFNFLESYLNGIAVDHLSTNQGTISEKERIELSEWDHLKRRPRFLSLRDKLTRYPRIVLGAARPPLTEDNCQEMKFMVREAKLTRDAIVHASPAPDPKTLDLEKYLAVDLANISEAERVVDSAISLVRKLDIAVHGSDERVSVWLHDRDKDGYFSHGIFDEMRRAPLP